jgi:nitric oxide reductase activation protein
VQGKESGYVDIPLAIQVLAQKSQRNDVFVREELDTRSESWAILVDSSKSLENIQGRVRDVTVCLTEVAKELIPNPYSWACYAFNEKMYVVKDFTEIYGNECRGRIGGLGTGIKTLLPDALKVVGRRLAETADEVKVILLASDGYPLGYDGIDAKLLDVIDGINKSGINLIGLGVGSSMIQKFFKTNCIINSPSDLMREFVKTYMGFASTL